VCILHNQRDATYTMFFIIIDALRVSGGFSGHLQELINLHVRPWVLSCFPAIYHWCDKIHIYRCMVPWTLNFTVWFEVVTAVTTKAVVFWNVMACSVTEMLLMILLTPSIFFFYFWLLLHLYTFHTHTCIYFNFQFHKDILLPYSHFTALTVHSETAVLKGPILFLCTSISRILSCPQRCPHMPVFPSHGYTHLLWQWKKYDITKCRYAPTRLYGVTSQ